jgi:hypothetical protein
VLGREQGRNDDAPPVKECALQLHNTLCQSGFPLYELFVEGMNANSPRPDGPPICNDSKVCSMKFITTTSKYCEDRIASPMTAATRSLLTH